MTKTIVKKKKLRIGRLLFLLLFVAVIGLFLYFLATTKIKNIIIKGNKLLSDEEIKTRKESFNRKCINKKRLP